MKKKFILASIFLLAIIVLVCLGLRLNRPAVQNDRLELAIEPLKLQKDHTYDVDVILSVPYNQPVLSWEFNLGFDPDLIRINSLSEGPFFNRCPAAQTTFFSPGKIDNQSGTIEFVAAGGLGIPFGGGCTGSGKIVTVNLTAINDGQAVFTFSNIEVADVNFKPYEEVVLRSGPILSNWFNSDFVLTSISHYPDIVLDRSDLSPLVLTKRARVIENDIIQAYNNPPTHSPEFYSTLHAVETQMPIFVPTIIPTVNPTPTPTAFTFHSTKDFTEFILDSNMYREDDLVSKKICPKSYKMGDPYRITNLDTGMDYYYVPFYVGSNKEICADYMIEVRDGGAYLVAGGGRSRPNYVDWKDGGMVKPGLPKFPGVTLEQALGVVKKLGYEITGDPRMVYMETFNDWLVEPGDPAWEMTTTDGKTLYVGDSYPSPVVLFADQLIRLHPPQ
jgi:hypothetical protein